MGRSFAVCSFVASLGRIYIDIPFLGNRIDILTDYLITDMRITQNPLREMVIAFPLLSQLCCVFSFDGTK